MIFVTILSNSSPIVISADSAATWADGSADASAVDSVDVGFVGVDSLVAGLFVTGFASVFDLIHRNDMTERLGVREFESISLCGILMELVLTQHSLMV